MARAGGAADAAVQLSRDRPLEPRQALSPRPRRPRRAGRAVTVFGTWRTGFAHRSARRDGLDGSGHQAVRVGGGPAYLPCGSFDGRCGAAAARPAACPRVVPSAAVRGRRRDQRRGYARRDRRPRDPWPSKKSKARRLPGAGRPRGHRAPPGAVCRAGGVCGAGAGGLRSHTGLRPGGHGSSRRRQPRRDGTRTRRAGTLAAAPSTRGRRAGRRDRGRALD